ncbi:NERD domain-containing protein [Streptomyces sp. LE64]|uniref:NERD domain-containing protein n=1 Tax=Streptomyces sp. LE64 TaxID=3448653 RepID=UPI0040424521
MSDLRVVPVREHGRDLLHVTLRSGRTLAWYDHEQARVTVLSTGDADAVLAALAPYLSGRVTVGPPVVPGAADLARLALHPDDDLAPNRPGEALRIDLERVPASRHRFRGRDDRPEALAAEEATGAALEALEPGGWRVLHSVPLPGTARLAHLTIGPAGSFAVSVVAGRGRRVRIADPQVTVGRSAPVPLLRTARSLAERASHALTAPVAPVLVVVGAGALTTGAAPRDLRVLAATELAALGRTGGVLKPAEVETLYATARDRGTWRRL